MARVAHPGSDWQKMKDRSIEGEASSAVSPVGGSPGQGGRRHSRGGCGKTLLFVVLCGFMALPLIGYYTGALGDLKRGAIEIIDAIKEDPEPVTRTVEKIVEVEVEKIVEVPQPPPPAPSKFIARRAIDTAELYNGFHVKSVMELSEGRSATIEREDPEGYEIRLEVHLKVPRPSQTIEDFERLNPDLDKLLPDFGKLIESSRVSGFYHKIYDLKSTRVQQNLTRLDKVLTRHNYYDLESILEMQHPETKAKVLLIQAEMDVVSDGTDGDRMPDLNGYFADSANFQPFTSYAWPKRSQQPNPLLVRWEAELRKAEEEYKTKGLSAERNAWLRDRIAQLKREASDMKSRSFLIAETDPFVVVPLSMLGYTRSSPYAPAIGDYAVIAHRDRLCPAIVGDSGPTFQVGEASLRIARELNDKAGVYSRPESDLKVTYLIFPGSAEAQRGPPDLERWHARCMELLEGIGGIGDPAMLHQWEDLLKPEEPAPAP